MDGNKGRNGCIKEIKLISSLNGRGQKRESSNRVLPRLLLEAKSERPEHPLSKANKESAKAQLYLYGELGKYHVNLANHASEMSRRQVHGYMLDHSTFLKSKHKLATAYNAGSNWKSVFEESVSANEELKELFHFEGRRQDDV